jgi:GT2 family glycosyltransferase
MSSSREKSSTLQFIPAWQADARERAAPARMFRIAVGIATAGRREQLTRTLEYLARQRRAPDRLIVCPARPDDYDPSYRAPGGAQVELVRAPVGLCAQRNAILDASKDCDLLVFFDDDFYPAADYLARVERLFVDHSELVIATGTPVLDGAKGPGLSHDEAVSVLASLGYPAEEEEPVVLETYGGYGCNMTLRTALVHRHGLRFDERLPLYGWLEDIDFSRRLAAFGSVMECRQLRGVHLGTKSGRGSGARLGYSQIANPIYMVRKGSMSSSYALKHMVRNVLGNVARAALSEPWVDRPGRLRGNLHALVDLARGKLHPQRALLHR